MSSINGLGNTDYSIPAVRPTAPSPEADFLSLTDSTVQPTAVGSSASSSAQSSASSQQEQDREEAFAKMMVNLQSSTGQVTTPNSSDSSNELSAASAVGSLTSAGASNTTSTSTQSAADEFKAYMSLTPAQQMRYGALKSMGLTEADVKAMSPDAAAKVDAKVATIIKKQTEMQAATTPSGGATSSGTSASTGDKGTSFLNSALLKLTQDANDTNAKLDLA
jgi:hypothetical protein